jgi:hypothetical protein
MFNKIYKFLKLNVMSPSRKQKCRIFLAKDLRQYRLEYRELMSHMIGNNWVLGNKSIDIEHLTLKKFLRVIVLFLLFSLLIYLII